MPTNLALDSILLLEAQKIGGFKTKKETVNSALAEFIRRHKQMQIIKLFGKIEYDQDYGYKNGRNKI